MGLAVNTKHLLDEFLPMYELLHNRYQFRFGVDVPTGRHLQLHRVCVYAIVTHDAAARAQFAELCGRGNPRTKAALEWQAQQGVDEDDLEVLYHLKHLAATTTKPGVRSPLPSGGVDSRAGTTTLVASVQSPTFTSSTRHRPPSSFRRFSSRYILEEVAFDPRNSSYGRPLSYVTCFFPNSVAGGIHGCPPEIVPTNADANFHSLIWLVHIDLIDLSSQSTYSTSSQRKRRRTLDPFHHISPRRDGEHTTRAHDHPAPEAKRFKGVRYRADHNRWVAEVKPPKSKNKVSFGEFRSQTDAARVVDVAFQHYGRPLNFHDTPRILGKLPLSAGLSAEEKLKDQIKWMKDILPTLQPSPPEPGVTSPTPNPSTSETNSGLRPCSAMGSSLILVGSDGADDAVSQPQQGRLQALMSSDGMADGKETSGAANGSGEGPQSSTVLCSVETAVAHDPSDLFGMSAEHCGGTLTTVVSSQPIMDVGGSMPVDFTSAAPLFSMLSPGASQVEVADGSWEQESVVEFVELLESIPLDFSALMMH